MYDDLNDHPFAKTMAAESAASEFSIWDLWVSTAEILLGHDLDGDQAKDGYSLDYAYEAFATGGTPGAYVAHVLTDPTYKGARA